MKRLLAITVLVYLFFLLEFILHNIFGKWAAPNFLLLLVIFFDLYLGIRYGLWAAIISGFLKDAFSLEPLGTHVLAYTICAYLVIYMKKNFYQPGSKLSRTFVVFVNTVVYVFILTLVNSIDQPVDFKEIFFYVLLPEVIATTVVATFVFRHLKNITLSLAL